LLPQILVGCQKLWLLVRQSHLALVALLVSQSRALAEVV
jgi:hypothetical protein